MGFVRDEGALRRLSGRLGDFVSPEGLVTVEVHWSEERLEGAFALLVPDRLTLGAAAADAVRSEGRVDPAPLAGLMRAMGAYRQELGERFDLRLQSFALRLVFWEPETGSRCRVDGRINDPEGRGFGECFVCAHPRKGELPVCRTEGAWPSPVRGDKAARRMLASALRGGTG